MLSWMFENSLVVLGLALVAVPLCRLLRARPAACHLVWLVLLVRLVLPPVPFDPPEFVTATTGRLSAMVDAHLEGVGLAGHDALAEGDEATDRVKPLGAVGSSSVAAWDVEPALDAEGTAAASARLDLSWLGPAALAAWLLGGLVVVVRQARRCRSLARIVRDAPAAPDTLRQTVTYMARVIGVRRPDVRLVDGLGSPVVWSLRRPVFLWPRERERAAGSCCIRGIVAHELAHIRRRDHLVAWFEVAALAVCWWNPVFWFVRRRMRLHAEEACDAWAVWVLPESRRAYAEALIEVAAHRSTPVPGAPVLGVTDSEPRAFRRRLGLIMASDVSRRASPIAATLAAATAVFLLPGVGRAAPADPPATPLAGIHDELLPLVESARRDLAATALYEHGAWSEAATIYEDIVADRPDDGYAHHRLGHALLELGRLDEALPVFERQRLLRVEEADAEADIASVHAARGEVDVAFRHLAAALREGFSDLEWLSSDARLAGLRDDPRFDDVLRDAHRNEKDLDAGYLAVDSGRWDEAVATFRALRARCPGDERATHMLAYSLFGIGRYEEAEQLCAEMLESGYMPAVARYNTACARARLGRLDEAMDALLDAVAHGFARWDMLAEDPDLGALREHPGMVSLLEEVDRRRGLIAQATEAEGAGDPAGAAAAWGALAEVSERDARAHLRLARSLVDSGRADDAADVLRRYAPHAGKWLCSALFESARAQAALGDRTRALAYLEAAADTGFADAERLRDDDFLSSLHDDDRFGRMLRIVQHRARMESRTVDEKV